MCYISTVEFYLAIGKNEIMAFSDKWMNQEVITFSKINKTWKKCLSMKK